MFTSIRAPLAVATLGLLAVACAAQPADDAQVSQATEAAEDPSHSAVVRELRERNAGTPEEIDAQAKAIMAAAAAFDESAGGIQPMNLACTNKCAVNHLKCEARCLGMGPIAFVICLGVCVKKANSCDNACFPPEPPRPRPEPGADGCLPRHKCCEPVGDRCRKCIPDTGTCR